MNREKAIEIFRGWDGVYIGYSSDEVEKAHDMAIQALSQEPCDDAISRKWLKTAIHRFYYGLKHTPTEEDIQAYIDAAPPVTVSL